MQLSYEPLNNLLAHKDMTKTELRTAAGLSKDTLARIGKNESVTLSTIVSICEVLDCQISDVVEIIPSKDAEEKAEDKQYTTDQAGNRSRE